MRRCLIPALVGVAAVLAWSPAYGEEYTDQFTRANDLYDQKDYKEAIEAYLAILKQGVESASLYFNLGNAYFKDGDLGHAILYYLRARRLDPSDRDITDNLQFARQFSRVQMEGVQLNPIHSFVVSLVDPYRIGTLAWISSAFFVALVVFLILRYGLGALNPGVKAGTIVSLILLVVLVGLTTFKYRYEYLTRRGVIVAEEAPVRTGPSLQSDVELQGAPGLVVEILDETSEYYNVLFENKRRGWVKKDLVAEI